MKLIFLQRDEHQSFLQVDYNTLGIKVSYKKILSLLMGMIKHSQSTQSDKFAISQKRSQGWSSKFLQSKFLQVGIMIFDGSNQTCPTFPKQEVGNIFIIS